MVGLQEHWDLQEAGEGWNELVEKKVREWEQREWRTRLEGSSKLRLYRLVKQSLVREEYLKSSNIEGRRQMVRFRGGTNTLRIETGRWEGLQREERICLQCLQGVEDERHVLLHCNLYSDLRAKLFEDSRMRKAVESGDLDEEGWMLDNMLGGGRWIGKDSTEKKEEAVMLFMARVMRRRRWVVGVRRAG